MFGHFLLRGYSVGRRFSSVGRRWRNVAAVGGGHGAGLGRNELAACRVKRATLEYGGQSLHSRFDDGWRGAQARLVHSSAGNETMKSSAGQSTPLVGKENFEELRRELQAMDLSDRVSCIVDMADAYFQKRGRVDARIVDQFRDDVVEEVLADFKWSSLEVLTNPGTHRGSRIFSRFSKAPSGGHPAERLAARAARELNADREKASVENACTVISMLEYVQSLTAELLEILNSMQSLLADAVRKSESPHQLESILIVFRDSRRHKTGIDCSVPLLNAVYDRLTEILPETKIDFGRKQAHEVALKSVSIRSGRVLHVQFLTAWTKHLHRLLLNEDIRLLGITACNILDCFAYFNHPCPELANTVLAGLESGRFLTSKLQLEDYINLLHSLLMLNVELPQPVVHHVISRLDPHTMVQLPKSVLNHLEQLLASLPLSDGLFLNLLQFMQRVPYYYETIAAHFTRQKMSSAAWQHVILDAALPGGRVPVICMLSCMGKKTVVPWPEWLEPFAINKEDAGKYPGIPVAVLVPHWSHILREPPKTVTGGTRFQKESLEAQGYKVFCIASQEARNGAHHCSSVGELIEITEKQ